jgi:hypothetical protein
MPIRVTCPGCHTRFNVSDRFAGQKGPCPKCKAVIRIPAKSEEVVIHAPPEAGPKDAKGKSVSKPIFRQDLVISPLQWTTILGIVVAIVALALLMRLQYDDPRSFPWIILGIGAVVLAVPVCYAGYGLLRNSELGSYLGQELWMRVATCAVIYAALWLSMPLANYAMNGYGTATWVIACGFMFGIGGLVGMSIFDFDYLMGTLHYGMYFGGSLLLRWMAGIGIFPGQTLLDDAAGTRAAWRAFGQAIGWWI